MATDSIGGGRLELSDEAKEALRKFQRVEKGRIGVRALAILGFDAGRTEEEIAELLGVSVRTVRRWISKYRKEGLGGLYDKERSGRPRKVDEKVEKEINNTMKSDPTDFGYKIGFWVIPLLCLHLLSVTGKKISGETIRRALHRQRFTFRRPKLWAGPAGEMPEEISKALKEARKGAAVLLYGDETTFHLLPVLRRMWMRVGEQAKILTPSSWNKAFSVFGTLNTVSGELFWEIFDRKNSDYFSIFLERLLSAHPDKIIYFVVDRASYHTSKKVKEWLSKHERIRLVYLPPRSPQLNPVEPLWRWLKGEVAANRTYNDLQPLQCGCREQLSDLTHEDALKITGALKIVGVTN